MNGEDLKNFFKISPLLFKRFKKEIFAFIGLAVFSIFFFKVIYAKNKKEITAVDVQITGMLSEIAKIKSDTESTENISKAVSAESLNMRRLEQGLKDLKERLPSDKRISRILAEISDNDIKRDIRIISIKPLPPEDKGELVRLPFQITLEAKYSSFGDYLERIENLPRLIVIDNFMVEPKSDNSPVLNCQVYLSTYVFGFNR